MEEYSYNFQERVFFNKTTPQDIEGNWPWALLSYMGPISLLVFLIKKDSSFARYHARQGLGLFAINIFWSIVWILVNSIIPADIPYLFLIITTIFIAGFIGLFSVWLAGVVNSFKGAMQPIPIFGSYFEDRTTI